MRLGGAVTTERFSERTRSLLTLVNLHYAGLALLAVINLFLLTQMYLAWRVQSTQGVAALAQQMQLLQSAQAQARPLEGLDSKLATASAEADRFYSRRLPYAYSEILTELGVLTKKSGVKLTRTGYAETPALEGTPQGGALTELRMDATLRGDYRSLVQLVNALERDKMFFVIGGVTLSGQQSGTVGLRLRLITYLRPTEPGEVGDRAASTPLLSEPAADVVAGGSGR